MTSDEQREHFEAAMTEMFGAFFVARKEDDNVYVDELNEARWQGWQACAAQQAPQARADELRAGIEAAAKLLEKKREDFDNEHGYADPETGVFEYGIGAHARAKEEYSNTLAELAEEIRALAANPQIASEPKEQTE